MLVLTRKVGDKMVIGNQVLVEVLSVSGEGVRLGITAPKETSIHRYEVYAEIQAANQTATAAGSVDESQIESIALLLKSKTPEDKNP